jgi:hypothetical protein
VNLVDIARTIRGNGKNKINDLVAVRKKKNIRDKKNKNIRNR